MRNSFAFALLLFSLMFICAQPGNAQSSAAPTPAAPSSTTPTPAVPTPAVPPTEISADLGTCSALINVTGADTKPIFNAKVTTRVHYGMMGVKKIDLETYTSASGQVKIVKLPEVPKKPIYIYVSKDDMLEMVEFMPDVHCRATFDVKLK